MKLSNFHKLGMAVGGAVVGSVLLTAGPAHAIDVHALSWSELDNAINSYSCGDAVYGTNGSWWSDANAAEYATSRSTYTYSGAGGVGNNGNCDTNHTSNTSGAVVTAGATLRAAVAQTTGIIASRINQVRQAELGGGQALTMNVTEGMEDGVLGLAGGDKNRGIGVWVQGRWTKVKDSNEATKFNGRVGDVLAGVDYAFSPQVLAGLAVGYEDSDLTTTYNRGKITGDGWMVSPYASFALNRNVSVDVTAGYAMLDYKTSRLDPITDEAFSGKTDASRYWGGITGNYRTVVNNWNLGGHLGLNYSREKRDAYNENGATTGTVNVASVTSKLGQAIFGGTAGYNMGMIEPYVRVLGAYDYSKSKQAAVAVGQTKPKDDDFGVNTALGMNLNLGPNASAVIEGNYEFLRSNYKEYGGMARLRIEF